MSDNDLLNEAMIVKEYYQTNLWGFYNAGMTKQGKIKILSATGPFFFQ